MPKALFITTHTSDTHNHVDAWDWVADEPASRVTFNYQGVKNDGQILEMAQTCNPKVIFYIGAHSGPGLPKDETLRTLRSIAPSVNLISDAADRPWHYRINHYRNAKCFDLHVGIDGDPVSPVDLVTLTPVNGRAFDQLVIPKKDIRCGFSGNASGKRARLLGILGSRCFVRVRGEDYKDHASFLKRCRIIFNTAYTGSGERYHIKGRVVEAGFAGGALLEHVESPIKTWFPEEAYFTYEDAEHAGRIVETATDEDIKSRAALLSKIVREKYTPAKIYGQILDRLNVGHALAVPAR